MPDHEGLPVAGYTSQPATKVIAVNVNKELEERVLRRIDEMSVTDEYDQRMISLARTNVQQAFMWLNRAVFQPTRVKLPEDN